MRVDKLVKVTIAALEDIKGHDIVTLDVRKKSADFDKLIICSGDSMRQNKALASNVLEKVKAQGGHVIGMEGADSGEWVLVDLGAVVVHIMQPAVRQYYNLEELWGGAVAPPKKRASAARSLKAP